VAASGGGLPALPHALVDGLNGLHPLGSDMKKALVLSSLILTLGGGALADRASAQMSSDVQFQPGNYGTMLSGTVKGREYYDYKLRAGKGQELFAELTVTGTNGNGSAFFNILPPGSSGTAVYVGSSDTDRSARITLPADGVYTIRVYLMGNDRDAGRTVSYNIDLSIQ
jgi:hypothetical protein